MDDADTQRAALADRALDAPRRRTGCTVVLCEPGRRGPRARCAGPRRARARPTCCGPGGLVGQVHAVLLAGGSAFGLAAADGVHALAARARAPATGPGVPPVPIVPARGDFRRRARRRACTPTPQPAGARCEAAVAAAEAAAGAPRARAPARRVGQGGRARSAQPRRAGPGRAARRRRSSSARCMVVNALRRGARPGQRADRRRRARRGRRLLPTLDLLAARAAAPPAAPNTMIGVVATNVPLRPAALASSRAWRTAAWPARSRRRIPCSTATRSLPSRSPRPAPKPPASPARTRRWSPWSAALAAEAVVRAILNAVTGGQLALGTH